METNSNYLFSYSNESKKSSVQFQVKCHIEENYCDFFRFDFICSSMYFQICYHKIPNHIKKLIITFVYVLKRESKYQNK